MSRSLAWMSVYCLAVFLGRQTAHPESGLALFWPAAGVAALWVLRSRRETVPLEVALLFTATAVVNQAAGVMLAPALVFGVANVAVGLLVRAVVIRAGEPRPDTALLASTRGIIVLAVASVLAGLVSAPLGTMAGYLISGTWSPLGVLAWVVRNTTGVFVVVSAVLAVVAAHRARVPGGRWTCCLSHDQRPRVGWELVGAASASGTALALVFGPDQTLPIAFLPLAISAFIGFRFAPVVAAVHALGAGGVAVAATMSGGGPFGDVTDPLMGAMVVQGWVLTQTAIALALSWAVAERQRLTSALEEARREADERAQLLDAVTETVAHGIAVIDEGGRVLIRNGAAERLVPGPAHQITDADHPADYGIADGDGGHLGTEAMPHVVALAQGIVVETQLSITQRGQGTTRVHVRAEPLEITGDRPHRVAVISLQDVTAHHTQVQQLESFAGIVAHDLQNPLGAVTAWAQLLADHLDEQAALDSRSADLLDHIDRAGQGMSDLITDLLTYASASSAPLDLQTVDLDHLVTTIGGELRAASPTAPLITKHPLGTLQADPLLIRQVVANVLGNAVKYAADGVRPHVRVARGDDAGFAVLTITDNGIGIPAEMRASVFEGFTRVPGTASTRPGTGLGLAICARAVERHGGTILAGPGAHGQGTTITVRIPDRTPTGSGRPGAPSPYEDGDAPRAD